MSGNEPRWADRPDGTTWISHWSITGADLAALAGCHHLTLWNVKLPVGFRFEALPRLEYLDIRGGTKADLSALDGCDQLQALVVNQVRGLSDLSALSSLVGLRLLSLYGLARVERLPDLSRLERLERLEIGQMRNLTDWTGLATPPGLREVFFHNQLQPERTAVDELAMHPTLEAFDWVAPDVPQRVQGPVHELFSGLTRTQAELPAEWLRRTT